GAEVVFAFAPDGKFLAAGGPDGTIALCDTATGKVVRTLTGHRGAVHGVAFSGDARALASGAADGTARIWEVATGKELHRFRGHAKGVRSVALAADGKTLATAGEDDTLRLWDVATGKERHRLTMEHNLSGVRTVVFAPGEKQVVSGGVRWVGYWDIPTRTGGRQPARPPPPRRRAPYLF